MTGTASKARFSLVTALKPERLSKGFKLDINGDLEKLPGGILTEGSYSQIEVSNLAEFGSILSELGPTQALMYGIGSSATGKIITQKRYHLEGRPFGAVARSKEFFSFPNGKGIMMLDYDPKTGSETMGQGELVSILRQIAPTLVDADMLWFLSASSCIYNGNREIRGVCGQRLYLMVRDARDIPRAGKALIDRLWLAGYGHYEISKSGQLLSRTLFDASVWQGNRLDFGGGAQCHPPLRQDRGMPRLIKGSNEVIDTELAFPALSEAEIAQLNQIKSHQRELAQPQAEEIRQRWISDCLGQFILAHGDDQERTKNQEDVLTRAVETHVLSGDFEVFIDVRGTVQRVSIAEILDNRERYNGCQTRDPLEPEYDGGRLVGKLFLQQQKPILLSFAHGGCKFHLVRGAHRIQVVAGHTVDAMKNAIKILQRDPCTFDFGDELVVVEDERFHLLEESSLTTHLAENFQFWKIKIEKGVEVPIDIDPPLQMGRQMLAQKGRRHLKPLRGVVTAPLVRLDGTLLDAPGYDPLSRLYLSISEVDPPLVSHEPTYQEAAAALDAIWEPFAEFPFADAHAKGACLAAILTAVERPILSTAPAFAFDAPVQGSGKTLLAKCIGAIASGRAPEVWPHTGGRDDEETRKRIFTALRQGSRALIWDNVIGVFDSPSIASLLTSEIVSDRVLGKSEANSVPNRMLLMITGNNLIFEGDLPRRVIPCRIDPRSATPFAREFRLDPLQHVLTHRTEICAAACTLIRASVNSGAAPPPGRMGSFEDWDTVVRRTVVWVDKELRPGEFADPMALVIEAQMADPALQSLELLLERLNHLFGTDWFTSREVILRLDSGGDVALTEAVSDLTGHDQGFSTRSIGKMLTSHKDRVAGGFRLITRLLRRNHGQQYRVERVPE